MEQPQKPTLRIWLSQLLLGISSGLPFLLTGSTLQVWMTEQKVDIVLIGAFSLVKTPYSFKFLWSPLMDRFRIPGFKRRKGWLLLTQILLFIAIATLGTTQSAEHVRITALLALLISFFSASQDIVIDAFRREILPENMLGLGNSVAIVGYRIGMLIAGVLALFLANAFSWPVVYWIMACLMGIGILGTILAPERDLSAIAPKTLRESVIEPFKDFFTRSNALLIFAFIIFYKLGDNIAANLNVPFILAMGYTKTEYATIAKVFGMLAVIGGGLIGGFIMVKIGIRRALWYFGFFQAFSVALFILISNGQHSLLRLGLVIVGENLAIGMGSAAFVAYLSSLTSLRFTATQYALLSSLAAVPANILSAPAGLIAKNVGWVPFYLICTVAAAPGMCILWVLLKKKSNNSNMLA